MCRLLLCWMSILTLPGFSGAQYGAGGAGAVTYPSTNANFGAYSIPDIIDNQVVDTPSIRCTDRGVEFSINTRNPFRGNIYVQGEFGLAECRREFYNNEAPVAGIEVRLGDCGMIREKRPHGMSYSLILITNFHPRFVTRVDRAYKIFCSYQQAERPVGVDLEVGSVPEESVSSDALMVPDCEYTMRVGDLNGPLASATVKVGELIYHRWECQRSDLYGMLVKNCRVFDGGNDNVTLLDDRGCPTHTGVIQSPPVYSDGLNMAFAPVFAFHFPDRTQMNFRCQIQSCNKLDNECQGLTPPNCQQNYGGSYGSVQPTGVPYPPREEHGIPPPIDSITATFGPIGPTVSAPGAVYQQPPPPFIGAGISPSSPPNTLPLASVLQGNPSQVLQGLQRPWGKQQQRTATMQSAGRAAHKREQMELEQRILMATQQLRRTADGSWPPSLVIFGANKSAVGGESAIARRFFRPIPSEERELRQRQRRAEEHTQDVTATSTVINDGLHGLEWSNEDGKTRVRPRDWVVSKSNKSAESSATRSTQCLDRSTLVALFAALGMFSALAIALLCYVIWDLLVSRRRCGGKRLISWRSKGVASATNGNLIFDHRKKRPIFEVSPPHGFSQHPISSPQTERSVQEEVQSPQTVLAGILTSNLFGNGVPPPPPPPNGRPIPSKNVRR
uniref:ZP domain-containing protein n=1 Tax=Globodera pallida TaxID=36090 RepID=A0A183CPK6_GLOPA